MGYVGYNDDINDRIEENKEGIGFPIPTVSKPIHKCFYCNEPFESFDCLNNHIKRTHNEVGPLLIINGKIITDEYYVDEFYSAKIVLYGLKNIDISIDNQNINYKNNEIDLIPFLKAIKECYTIIIGHKKIRIHKRESEHIINSCIDDIIENWETQTNKGETLHPSQGNYPISLNKVEISYLNGFFDYFTACKTLTQTDKNNRYETAFAILSSISMLTPKARVLLKIIAFRFNWIEKLVVLSKATKGAFDIVVDFYYERNPEKAEIDYSKGNEQRIFVEDDIEKCFYAIKAYQNGNWIAVNDYLNYWSADEKISEIKDINQKDRILLLKARQMKKSDNYQEAKKYYSEIKTPFVRKEAEKFSKEY